jgi:hypothetical protein
MGTYSPSLTTHPELIDVPSAPEGLPQTNARPGLTDSSTSARTLLLFPEPKASLQRDYS